MTSSRKRGPTQTGGGESHTPPPARCAISAREGAVICSYSTVMTPFIFIARCGVQLYSY